MLFSNPHDIVTKNVCVASESPFSGILSSQTDSLDTAKFFDFAPGLYNAHVCHISDLTFGGCFQKSIHVQNSFPLLNNSLLADISTAFVL